MGGARTVHRGGFDGERDLAGVAHLDRGLPGGPDGEVDARRLDGELRSSRLPGRFRGGARAGDRRGRAGGHGRARSRHRRDGGTRAVPGARATTADPAQLHRQAQQAHQRGQQASGTGDEAGHGRPEGPSLTHVIRPYRPGSGVLSCPVPEGPGAGNRRESYLSRLSASHSGALPVDRSVVESAG